MPSADQSIADPRRIRPKTEWFVRDWLDIVERCAAGDSAGILTQFLPQFAFEAVAGMSRSPAYLDAIRPSSSLGIFRNPKSTVSAEPLFRQPAALTISLYQTAAGLVPVLNIGDRADFEFSVRVLVYRNEPADIPSSMGSMLVDGVPNPTRHRHLGNLRASGVLPGTCDIAQLSLDTLILITDGPYSGIEDPSQLSIGEHSDADWRRISAAIRLEHEACHYCARRLYPGHRFSLRDELVADFIALFAVCGPFHSADFAYFMGLEKFPEYRNDGRFAIYLNDTPPGSGEFQALAEQLLAAADQLQRSFQSWSAAQMQHRKLDVISVLTHLSLKQLASPQGGPTLDRLLDELDS